MGRIFGALIGRAAPLVALCTAALMLFAAALVSTPAAAADMEVPAFGPPPPPPYTGFEARFGAFYHGLGNPEKNTVDLSGEFVIAKPFLGSGYWTYLIPRPHIGGSLNLSGKTSFV